MWGAIYFEKQILNVVITWINWLGCLIAVDFFPLFNKNFMENTKPYTDIWIQKIGETKSRQLIFFFLHNFNYVPSIKIKNNVSSSFFVTPYKVHKNNYSLPTLLTDDIINSNINIKLWQLLKGICTLVAKILDIF